MLQSGRKALWIAALVMLAPSAWSEPRQSIDAFDASAEATTVDLLTAGARRDPALARALRTPDDAGWPEAAVLLHRAAAARSRTRDERAELEFRLAIALYESRLYCASRTLFERIARDPKHPAFRRALPWIARLAEHLPEPAGLERLVRRYTDADAAALRDPDHRELYWTQAYLRGADAARRGRHAQAVRLFSEVEPESGHYVDASFGAAQSQIAVHEPIGALWTLGALLHNRAVWHQHTYAPGAVEDLAHLTMARILYSKAVRRLWDGTILVQDSAKLRAALDHYALVGRGDPQSADARQALLESAWARFLLGDLRAAAQGVQRVAWGWLSSGDAVSEQALLFELRLRRQQGDASSSRLAVALRRQVAERRRGIQRLIDEYGHAGTQAELVTRALEVIEGVSSLDTELCRSLEQRVLGPRVLRAMNYVRVVEYEIATLDRMPEVFRKSALRAEIDDALSHAYVDAISVAAERTQRGLRNAAAELDEVLARSQERRKR